MCLKNIFLTVLLGLGTALVSSNAQAQSADSTSPIKPRIVAEQAKDSTKAHTKTIRLVSKSTFSPGNSPLIVVDGNVATEEDIKSINPNDIDKIEILKGTTATALYGSRAANGVIIMTLKHPRTKLLHQPDSKKGHLD